MTRSSKANVKRTQMPRTKGVKKRGEVVNGIEPTKLESLGQIKQGTFFKRNHGTFKYPAKMQLCSAPCT